MAVPENEHSTDKQGPVIRDKRRIDPETGQPRGPEGEAASPSEDSAAAAAESTTAQPTDEENAELIRLRQEVAERTDDLKRLQAEYINYRKRVDRDRAAMREQALVQVLTELLPILDDIGRARQHNELVGGFKSVGEALESLVARMGLKKYGEKGDEFDPTVHEALSMVPSTDVTVPTVIEVFQPGYLIGDRVVRPARVVVAGPAEEDTSASEEEKKEEAATEEAAAPSESDDEAKPAEASESAEAAESTELSDAPADKNTADEQ